MLRLREVLTGELGQLGGRGVLSGIDKRPVSGRVRATYLGIEGDCQADRKHHGGVDKAVHHYPFDHYDAWLNDPDLKQTSRLAQVGAFGENISTLGLNERAVCVGDVWKVGTAIFQVTQARQPCWKLNERFANKLMARKVQETGRTGWYYRVLEEGELCAGDEIILMERVSPDWPLSRALAVLHDRELDTEILSLFSELPGISGAWKDLACRRIHSREIEDWTHRLSGDDGST